MDEYQTVEPDKIPLGKLPVEITAKILGSKPSLRKLAPYINQPIQRAIYQEMLMDECLDYISESEFEAYETEVEPFAIGKFYSVLFKEMNSIFAGIVILKVIRKMNHSDAFYHSLYGRVRRKF